MINKLIGKNIADFVNFVPAVPLKTNGNWRNFALSASIEKGEGARDIQENRTRIGETSGRGCLGRLCPPAFLKFYLQKIRPTGLAWSQNTIEIPQKLPGGTGPYFVTLYDEGDHIPVYSAYTVTPAQAVGLEARVKKPNTRWRTPPG